MVEVDITVGVRSIEALIKEAPRGWSPTPPNFQAERHELDVVVAALLKDALPAPGLGPAVTHAVPAVTPEPPRRAGVI